METDSNINFPRKKIDISACASLDQKVSLVKTHGSKLALKALVMTSPDIALCFPTAS